MANIIARIHLAPGESGYYDDISDISMNWRRPEANVYEGTDCSGLRKSVKAGRIIVTEGTLGISKSFKQILMEKKAERTGESLESLMGDSPIVYEEKPPILSGTADSVTDEDTNFMDIPVTPLQSVRPADVNSTDVTENTTDTGADVGDVTESEKPEEAPEPVVETVTAKPASLRSLKVGTTREIVISHDITEVVSSDEDIVTASIIGKTIVATGVSEGKAIITATTTGGNITISVTVTA